MGLSPQKSDVYHNGLVVWNHGISCFSIFFHILGMSSPQLTFIFFRGVQTTNQIIFTLKKGIKAFWGIPRFPTTTSGINQQHEVSLTHENMGQLIWEQR